MINFLKGSIRIVCRIIAREGITTILPIASMLAHSEMWCFNDQYLLSNKQLFTGDQRTDVLQLKYYWKFKMAHLKKIPLFMYGSVNFAAIMMRHWWWWKRGPTSVNGQHKKWTSQNLTYSTFNILNILIINCPPTVPLSILYVLYCMPINYVDC